MEKVVRKKDEGSVWTRYKKSFFHAVDGIVYIVENEHNILIMMICAILVFIFGFIFPVSMIEIMILVILISSVMACEAINSAIEAVVDLVTVKDHPLAKIAKDTGSAASLILSFAALICGGIIFIPKILDLFLK